MIPFLVIDTETTGVDPATARVVELGACHFQDRRLTRYRRRVNPGAPIPAEASAVHGIRDDDVRDAPSFADVAPRFLGLLDGKRLVGYNARAYDVPLLNSELALAGRSDRLDPDQVLDVLIFIRWHLRHLRARDLSAVCSYIGIALADAHSAAGDAQATGLLLQALVARGHVPADLDAALTEQARLAVRLDEEWTQWSYWLYRDRRDQQLRLGAGKHCGQRLAEVDPGYLRYCLDKIDDVPTEVRRLFVARCASEPLLEAAG